MTSILRLLLHNLGYKIIAVLLAIAFWYIVQSEQVMEINRKIEVELIPPEGLVVKGERIVYKDATLRGTRSLLNEISMDPIVARIKLFSNKPQTMRVRVDKQYIKGWDERIQLTVHDAYINSTLDKEGEKELPVKENLMGLPLDGFIIEKTIVHPEKITVRGPVSELLNMESVVTEPIEINQLSESKSFEVQIMTVSEMLQTSHKKVRVSLIIGEKKINRTFANVPVEVEDSEYQTKIKPSTVSIVLQGTPTVLSQVSNYDLRAFLNLKDQGPGVYQQKIMTQIPSDTVLIETSPEHAIIEIYKRKRNF
ncbi:MAG: hypothetical protein HYW48_09405 [Deltaproteobacteria bacterium]|nr:hypothetical protein [Deltaproteobacteria bacterium]